MTTKGSVTLRWSGHSWQSWVFPAMGASPSQARAQTDRTPTPHLPTKSRALFYPPAGSDLLGVFLHGVEDEADVGEVVERPENKKRESA